MTMKVTTGFGFSGMLVAIVALMIIGFGATLALGAVILLSPLTAAVFILILFIIVTAVTGGSNKSLYITIAVFLILAILFGRAIQSAFETISPIFLTMEVIF